VENQAAMAQAVASERAAIGFGSVGAHVPGIRKLALAPEGSSDYVAPTFSAVASRRYPLSRRLYLYFKVFPGQRLDLASWDLVRTVCSKNGQQVVAALSYLPLPLRYCRKDLVPLLPRADDRQARAVQP
jgi:phosphate transport system substrate-binding protein